MSGDDSFDAIRAVRNWLSTHRSGVIIPGGKTISGRYDAFRIQLRLQAKDAKLDARDLTFGDYTRLVVGWLETVPW